MWNKEEFDYIYERCLFGKRRVNFCSQGCFFMVDGYFRQKIVELLN